MSTICVKCKKEIEGNSQHVKIETKVVDLICEYDTPLDRIELYHIPCYGKKFNIRTPKHSVRKKN